MAIFLSGIKCEICKKNILQKDEKIMFPSFVLNEKDPIYFFNDSTFHRKCFFNYRMSGQAMLMYDELKRRTKKTKECCICKKEITDPENYIFFGCFSSNYDQELSKYNFTMYHKTCFLDSETKKNIDLLISKMEKQRKWKGRLPY